MSIKSLGGTIAQELTQVFDRIDDAQVEAFIEAIINAKGILLIDAGREGAGNPGLHHAPDASGA